MELTSTDQKINDLKEKVILSFCELYCQMGSIMSIFGHTGVILIT